MRTRNYLIGVLALAATAAIPATASATVSDQTLGTVVTPSKLPKKGTPAPISLTVDTQAKFSAPTTDPSATLVDIDLDKNIKVNTKGLKVCDKASLTNTTPSQAIAVCGDAQVGSGTAELDGLVGYRNVVATAFLGAPQGSNPVLLIHVRVDSLSATQVLEGVITQSPIVGYGKRIEVTVPPLAGGHELLTHLNLNINKKFTQKKKVKGKTKKVKTGLLTSTCTSKTLKFTSVFYFSQFFVTGPPEIAAGPGPTFPADSSSPCTPKKVKK